MLVKPGPPPSVVHTGVGPVAHGTVIRCTPRPYPYPAGESSIGTTVSNSRCWAGASSRPPNSAR